MRCCSLHHDDLMIIKLQRIVKIPSALTPTLLSTQERGHERRLMVRLRKAERGEIGRKRLGCARPPPGPPGVPRDIGPSPVRGVHRADVGYPGHEETVR